LTGYIALASNGVIYGINILNHITAGETVIINNVNEPTNDLEQPIRFDVYWHYVTSL